MKVIKKTLSPFVRRVLFRGSKRTRIAIIHGKSILLVQDRISDGDWKLPGGGMKKNETPKACASREIKEELDITVGEADFVYLKTMLPSKDWPFTSEIIKTTLQEKPITKLSKTELSRSKWFQLTDIPSNVDKAVTQAIKLL